MCPNEPRRLASEYLVQGWVGSKGGKGKETLCIQSETARDIRAGGRRAPVPEAVFLRHCCPVALASYPSHSPPFPESGS